MEQTVEEKKEFEYVITCHVPICPHCGAGLRKIHSDEFIYICNDCKAAFKIIDKGQSENEFICNEIHLENNK